MTKVVRLIGDVHGKFEPYKRLIADVPHSVQIGDLGAGFRRTVGPHIGDYYANPPHYAMVRGDHRFIRGNHDNPIYCKRHSQWIPDGTIEGDVMYIGGALSIDRVFRKEGFSWWADEECSHYRLDQFVDLYLLAKPRVMITHECPEEIAAEILNAANSRTKLDPNYASRTRQAFQSMWSAHSPDLWVFGHWHAPFDHVLRGTRFVCLPELKYMDVEL